MAATDTVRGRRYSSFIAQPGALIAHPWEWRAAGLIAVLVGGIFVAELLTPYVVVSALELLPAVAAMWLLSSRPAAVVGALATVCFAASLLFEAANRWTVVLIAVAIIAVSALVRVHALALAAQLGRRRHLEGLTPRELEVVRLASQAFTAAEIGALLRIGERTVETHLANTYTKLRISSRRELVQIASKLGPP